MIFSNPDPQEFEITPLGAAIVEAMPDRKLMRRIKTRFKQKNECPSSQIFDARAVKAFYKTKGLSIMAVEVAP